ncbi:MAG: selenium-dependent molybdenum cofactor biosynthesis protein YqeB [Eubacteriales bacterium]|nr:selenium-dependent molybdenum cofactor biosynthesis protein YqeB [Eubacteriales bacterium]MDD3073018.1 selenium-dependent molybdenum cofactor biosynthesis protein YqeB [Eubacteriales bacterium]MDD4078441.1 selenium-dependent molybdenum cofactor biosynthesis protein YqeB [Eubacteriales bacterium]MDD4768470.1 selenium-dependent molybdenum cofactor biosynthesis protein YqeB [Eubacteriales bacterium]
MRLVVIRGAGEMASGTAHRLHAVGCRIIMTELPRPLAVRRGVAFAQAVYDGSAEVEGIVAVHARTLTEALVLCRQGKIAVLTKEIAGKDLTALQPAALVDGRLAKENLGTKIDEAKVVIGLGPGFIAGVDAHAVIETNRGHDLGRVLYTGAAQANTGNPGDIGGYREERVLKNTTPGIFSSSLEIGDLVAKGDRFGEIGGSPIAAPLSGVVRGLLMGGAWVEAATKLGDIDPRGIREYCFTISEKARAIGGGVLEALLHLGGGVDR